MLEASANNILKQDFQKAIKVGVKETQKIIGAISDLRQCHGKVKRPYEAAMAVNQEYVRAVER